MIFRKYIRESIDDMDKRCEFCNTLLNDGGTCPVCDDGEEDYGESQVEGLAVAPECDEESCEKPLVETMSNLEKLKAAYPELNFDTIEESVEPDEVIEEGLDSNFSFKGKDEQKEFFDLCKEIGIKTAGDLKRFVDENVTDGEEVLKTLRQYRSELGDDFEIQHEAFEGTMSNIEKLKAAFPELNLDESFDETAECDDCYSEYDDEYVFDDVEEDRRHSTLYGGDRMYCSCGKRLVRTEWGGYCPECEPEVAEDDFID